MYKIIKIYTATYVFLLPLPDCRNVMEALISTEIFDIEFSPELHVLKFVESKKVFFKNLSVRIYVTLWGIFNVLCLQN